MSEWRPDVLGAGFECTDIDLGEDDEGAVVATLVRSLPTPLPEPEAPSLTQQIGALFRGRTAQPIDPQPRAFENCDVLYIHGWSDYFFQSHVAHHFTERGARFFALDLRKYGRSLREGQTAGFIEDLESYDEEIDAAVEIMRASSSAPRRLVLLGHSTGGLVLSLWADRHRGVAEALMLNSPWLDLQISGASRRAIAAMVGLRARLTPHEVALPQLDQGFYAQAQRECCVSDELASINAEWRPVPSMPVRAAWLRAILEGHAKISLGIEVGAPACVMLSARSQFALAWNDEMAHADTVIDVDRVARASVKLGQSVTVERIDNALHDVFLSSADVRQEAFDRMDRWLCAWLSVGEASTSG